MGPEVTSLGVPSASLLILPFAAAVGNLISQLIPLLLRLALGTLSSSQFLQ